MTPTSSTILDLSNQTLATYERGPIRELIETEFELAVMQHIRVTNRPVTQDYESELHDAVVPAVFTYMMEHMAIETREGNTGTFTVYHLQQMRKELHRQLNTMLEIEGPAAGIPKKPLMHRVLSPLRRILGKRKRAS